MKNKKIKKLERKIKREAFCKSKKLRKFMIFKWLLKATGKLLVIGLVFFVSTFALYMFNGENKLIYYVIRPLLNKHYDSQVRDRKI